MDYKKLNIIFTFDVEAGHTKESIETLIWGRTSTGDYWGLKEQIALLGKYGIKGLFFVDFAEAWDFGEESIKEIVDFIIGSGHDVGMHIHPHHMGDSRQFLYEYSKNEQYYIINECTKLYRKLTGQNPVSFRAGKYGANYDTLDILCELGYKYDFSEFYSQRWCGLNPPLCCIKPTFYKSIIEFPVTVFKSFSLGNVYSRFDKLEIDINSYELLGILRKYSSKNNGAVISLFAHSFSFLDFRGRENNPRLIKRNVRKFIKCLEQTTQENSYKYLSEGDLDTIVIDSIRDDEKEIVSNGFFVSIPLLYLRCFSMIKYNKKSQLLILGTVSFIVLLSILISIII